MVGHGETITVAPIKSRKCNCFRCFGFGVLGFAVAFGLLFLWSHRVIGDPTTADDSILWPDTVKRGPMLVQVHGLGVIERAEGSETLFARVQIPETQSNEVKVGQECEVDTRNGIARGHVEGVGVEVTNGTRAVDISIAGPLPTSVMEGLNVDGTITIRTLENVVYVGRPVHGEPWSTVGLFKYTYDGREAVRVQVKLGAASVNEIQILSGLKPGDKVILSDMSMWDGQNRIKIN